MLDLSTIACGAAIASLTVCGLFVLAIARAVLRGLGDE